MILAESGRLVGLGLTVGVGVAIALVKLVSARLYGVSGSDPRTFAAAAALLILVAAVAALIPARRAASVDPMVAFADGIGLNKDNRVRCCCRIGPL